jgi:hypothetical protein
MRTEILMPRARFENANSYVLEQQRLRSLCYQPLIVSVRYSYNGCIMLGTDYYNVI